jgi:Replication factor-A C terminal domain
LIGVTPEEIQNLKNNEETEKVSAIFRSKKFTQLKGRMMAKLDNYGNESRTKYSLLNIYKSSFAEANRELLNEINEYI